MYVGIRDVCLFQACYPSIAQAMEQLELDSIELAVERNMAIPAPYGVPGGAKLPIASKLEAIEASQRYAELGIHISALLLANNFNAENRTAEVEWAAQTLESAEIMGVEAVRIDAAMTGQQTLPAEQRLDIFTSIVEEILDRTVGGTVPLAVENHGYQGNDPDWLRALLERIPSQRFGVTLDTANFYWAGQPLSSVYTIIEDLAPRVHHLHCKNINYPPKYRQQQRQLGWNYGKYVAPIPEGDIDHKKIIRILSEAGYQGGLHIEDESLAKFSSSERKRLLRTEADYLSGLLQQIGHRRYWSG